METKLLMFGLTCFGVGIMFMLILIEWSESKEKKRGGKNIWNRSYRFARNLILEAGRKARSAVRCVGGLQGA